MGKQLQQRLVLQLTYKNYIAFKKRQVVATDRQLVSNEYLSSRAQFCSSLD